MKNAVSPAAEPPDRGRRHYRTALGTLTLILILHVGSASGLLRPSRPVDPVHGAEIARLRLDPNIATRDELMLLPGIGPKLSDNIIEYRAAALVTPAFSVPEDLDNVARIGPITVEKLRPYLRFPVATDSRGPVETRP
jgi:hypothetical protein